MSLYHWGGHLDDMHDLAAIVADFQRSDAVTGQAEERTVHPVVKPRRSRVAAGTVRNRTQRGA